MEFSQLRISSSPSKFNFFLYELTELRVNLSIGSQWSESREIVRIMHSAELSG